MTLQVGIARVAVVETVTVLVGAVTVVLVYPAHEHAEA